MRNNRFSGAYHLDAKDEQLITLLDENSRMTESKIASAIQRNPQFVSYRLGKLIRNDILIGMNAVIDYHLLGLHKYRIYIKFRNIYPDLLEELALYFASLPSSNTVVEIEGYWDLGVTFLLPKSSDFNIIWDIFREKYMTSIHDYKMSIINSYEVYPKRFLIETNDHRVPRIIAEQGEKIQTDPKDKQIIRMLANESRTPTTKIARELGISATAVAARIRRLENCKIILGYQTNIRYKKIGYAFYRIDLMLSDIKLSPSVKEYIKQLPGLSGIQQTYNGADLEFEFISHGHLAFQKEVRNLLQRFKGGIRNLSHFRIAKFHKSRFMIGDN